MKKTSNILSVSILLLSGSLQAKENITNNISRVLADVNISRVIADANISKVIADVNISKVIADVNISKVIADANISKVIADVNITKLTHVKEWLVLPYAFTSAVTGAAGGIVVVKTGLFQPQTTLVASAIYGTEQDIVTNGEEKTANFSGAFFIFTNYKVPFVKNLFFSAFGLKGFFPLGRHQIKGDNASREEDAIISSGEANLFRTTFSYVLPIGEGINNPEKLYNLKDGFAMGRENKGGETPFVTGWTSIGLRTFYSDDKFENTDQAPIGRWNTRGLRIFLEHENTDYNLNPSKGYQFEAQYSKDFGLGRSLQSWDFLEAKYNQYFNLSTFSGTQQNVLALSTWTAYSFSWDNHNKYANTSIDANRPPPWEGARLGGFSRMRGYNMDRFSDKAAIYATAEYRAIINYNPFKKKVDWIQLVGFIEAGRVHDTYNLDLLSDLRYNFGISLRAMVSEIPMRLDVARGNEGTNVWVMVYQPFDF